MHRRILNRRTANASQMQQGCTKTCALRILCPSMIFLGVLLCSLLLTAQDNKPTLTHVQAFGVSPPLRELAKLPQPLEYGFQEAEPVRRIPKRSFGQVVDLVEQDGTPASGPAYNIGADFLGLGNGFPGGRPAIVPSDTNIAVGDSQLVQWVNRSYIICSKTSPYTCSSPIRGNTLWAAGLPGTACANHNDGDPIAQWDVAAHRWLLSQNDFNTENGYAPPYHACVAVSTSPDALGSYYLYQFDLGTTVNDFPDYPKWGIWPTGYFQTQNIYNHSLGQFLYPKFCAYNSAKLLVGDSTAEQICHKYTVNEDSLLPADRDSAIAPPSFIASFRRTRARA